jgi:branched-chain amino acid transport system permease protein
MSTRSSTVWKQAVRNGLIGGAVVVLLSLVGMVVAFSQRYIVSGLFTMGHVLLLAPLLLMGYSAARRAGTSSIGILLLSGALAGLVGGVVVAALVLIGQVVNLRAVLVSASSELYRTLAFGVPLPLGACIAPLAGLVAGAVGGAVSLVPSRYRNVILEPILIVLLLGLLRDLFVNMLLNWGWAGYLFRWLFAATGMSVIGAIVVLVVGGGLTFWREWRRQQAKRPPRPPQQQMVIRVVSIIILIVVLIFLPRILGTFFSEILDNVGLFVLMGLGLNIVVGLAGLLDMGYVAFYAIGAYVMGVLTSPELGFFGLSYWAAVPIALVGAALAGILLGLPVLKMRGDYLAIVTLGFGEIVRLVVGSDWLRPYLGGSQGIQLIAQPRIGPIVLNTQQELYYLILIGCLLAAFIAWRLKDSRIGRAWMAVREDEDVAQAMGINTVTTKLMAFAMGALFAGLSGTIFAAKLQSTYPHSFNVLVSINVLSLVIIGGMGSMPGVVVGALALMGLPDLLREFAEFRYLVYGALLVTMMLVRPEGLWPEARRRLELREE